MSSMPGFSSSEWGWGCFVSVFDSTDPTDHDTGIVAEPLHFRFLWSPRFATMEHSWANAGWSFCWHHYSRQHRGTCQIHGGHHGHHQRPGTGSSCWHGELYFPSQPSTPWAWRYTPLECLRWAPDHQHREALMVHQCSRESASSTRMKGSGISTEPSCSPTATPNSSLYWPLPP